MSFHEDRQSMFDKLLKDREKIFSKNKVQQEVIGPKRVNEKTNSAIKIEGGHSEPRLIQKP
jgi:hypothetical protein